MSMGRQSSMTPEVPGPKQLRDALERFAELLSNPASFEAEWQQFFAACPYVLSTALPLKLLPEDIVPLGRPGRSEADFVFYPNHTPRSHPSYGVIELKRPGQRLFTKGRKNVITLTRDAAIAVEQGRTYLAELESGSLLHEWSDALFVGTSAHVFILMGLSKDLRERVSADMFAATRRSILPSNFQLLPYDHLFKMFEANVPPRFLLGVPLLSVDGETTRRDEHWRLGQGNCSNCGYPLGAPTVLEPGVGYVHSYDCLAN